MLVAQSLVGWIPYGEALLYQGELIRYQSDHDDYVCSCERVAMLGGDGTDSSTRVPIVRSMRMLVATSYYARH
jgi:hypothetical protein